ncbi:hypothetical protein HGA34_05340 [Candidatus Falkowbacteria bacterium]|nr:hypothetical protein [Candidatus Falkowbacteria bacterium]
MNKNVIIAISVSVLVALPLFLWLGLRSPAADEASPEGAANSRTAGSSSVSSGLSVLSQSNSQVKVDNEEIYIDFNDGNPKLFQGDPTKHQFLKVSQTAIIDGYSSRYLITLLRCKKGTKVQDDIAVPYVSECALGIKKEIPAN